MEWRVDARAVSPAGATSAPQPLLVFSSGVRVKLLTSVPKGWEAAPAVRLEQMCRVAQPVAKGDVFAELLAAQAAGDPAEGDTAGSGGSLGSGDSLAIFKSLRAPTPISTHRV